MDTDQFEAWLKKEMNVEFKSGRWYLNDVAVAPANLITCQTMLQQRLFPLDEAREFLEQKLKTPKQPAKKKISAIDLGECTVGILLDELAKKPGERKYVDKQLPQMVVDNTLKKYPYAVNIPAYSLNENAIIEQYKLMMEMNKKEWGSIKNVEILFSNYIRKQRLLQEEEILRKIAFDPNKIAEADYFLGELYNLYQPAFVVFGDECRYDFEFFKGVIRHLIWNIKTKAWKGINKYPFMLNISGEQGNGKTSFVKHLCQDVLQNMFSVQNIDVLNDDFGSRLLADQWVLFFDELVQRNGNIDIDKLKQLITNGQVRRRIMFSQNYETNTIRCVFIGSANRPIYEVIHDETGNRRYLNIEFMNSSIKNYKPLHTVLDNEWKNHGLAIWQSVDENEPSGYLVGHLEELWDAARITYMSESNTVLQWLAGSGSEIRTSQASGENIVTLDDAHQTYKQYWAEKDRTVRTMTIASFKKFIRDSYNKRRAGKTTYTPGELRIYIGAKHTMSALFMQSPDEVAGDLTAVPPILDKFKKFIPVDLGPGTHLTDFLQVPGQVASADADGANASADVSSVKPGAESAVSGQISPNSDSDDDNNENIGNIGNMSECNRNLVLEKCVRACGLDRRRQRQYGDPAINDFDFGTDDSGDDSFDDMEPTEEEIQWYKENYGNVPDDQTPEEEAAEMERAEAMAEYLRDWWKREKERRRKEKLEETPASDDEGDDFFKRLAEG